MKAVISNFMKVKLEREPSCIGHRDGGYEISIITSEAKTVYKNVIETATKSLLQQPPRRLHSRGSSNENSFMPTNHSTPLSLLTPPRSLAKYQIS